MLIKKIITAGILFVILATSVVPVGVGAVCPDGSQGTLAPETGQEICGNGAVGTGGRATTAKEVAKGLFNIADNFFLFEWWAQWQGMILQRISGFFVLISGLFFDGVIEFTVRDMSKNLGPDSGIGVSITSAWTTLRDIANMVFIFVLLYTAFNAMFTSSVGNVGRNIVWIIIIALVINFSLFFSKVVIDASNVVSLGFYRAIINSGQYTINLTEDGGIEKKEAGTPFLFSGISAGYMRMLGIHSFWSPAANVNGASNILLIGIMTAIFSLIFAIILFIASIMFVSRFVILIFIMILSPVAFVMFIIPGMNGRFREWLNALINQSFFAPVFFALTWVVFKIGGSENFLNGVRSSPYPFTQIITEPKSAMGLVINYFIIIGFSIFALTTAKKMASSVAGFTAVSTALGGAAVGTVAWAGRNTIGRKALSIANDKDLRDKAAAGNIGARMKLWTAGQAAGSSFDMRSIGGTGAGKALGLDKGMDILGKAGGKGGFSKAIEEKAKAEVDYAKKYYGQTTLEGEMSKTAEAEYNKLKLNDEVKIKEQRELEIKKNEEEIEKIKKEIEENENNAKASSGSLQKQKEYSDKIKESRNRLSQINNINSDLRKKNKDNKFDDAEYDEETIKKKKEWESNKDAGKNRMKEFAARIKRGPLGIGFIGRMQGNQEAARKIIEAAEGKDKKSKKEMEKFLRDQGLLEKEEEDKKEKTEPSQ